MTVLVIVLAWLILGALGAWIATRHYMRLLPGSPASDLDFPNTITIAMGPLGLVAALFYIAAFSNP